MPRMRVSLSLSIPLFPSPPPLSLFPLTPLSRDGVPFLALCNCVPRTPVRPRVCGERRRCGVAWRGVKLAPKSKHVIEFVRICAQIRFAGHGRAFRLLSLPFFSLFPFVLSPFRSGIWRLSISFSTRLNETRLSKVRSQKRLRGAVTVIEITTGLRAFYFRLSSLCLNTPSSFRNAIRGTYLQI